ncbi:MAG TPA: hypothetical protein VLH56_08830 [Dissulfurispiraceae bacterium]|nr:hypothetical protein [Dissulfurispiraceae bacterium]
MRYEPTAKQLEKWSAKPPEMPSDDEFKTRWMKAHNGKVTGWGMGKRDWVALHANDHLTQTVDYNLGLWQGRVDAARGETAQPTPNYHTNPYDHGYYSGYNSFASFWQGFDKNARQQFTQKYVG